jgi:hypothetical protein
VVAMRRRLTRINDDRKIERCFDRLARAVAM